MSNLGTWPCDHCSRSALPESDCTCTLTNSLIDDKDNRSVDFDSAVRVCVCVRHKDVEFLIASCLQVRPHNMTPQHLQPLTASQCTAPYQLCLQMFGHCSRWPHNDLMSRQLRSLSLKPVSSPLPSGSWRRGGYVVSNSVLIGCNNVTVHDSVAYRRNASSHVRYNRSQTTMCIYVKCAFIAGAYK